MDTVQQISLSASNYVVGKLPKILEDDEPAVKSQKRRRWAEFTRSFHNTTMTVEELCQHIRSGFAISAELTVEYRDKKNFKSSQLVGLDFDSGDVRSSIDALSHDKFITDNALLIHTTSSHTAEHPRSRVLFLLDKPIADPDRFVRAQKRLLKRYKAADSQCHDPSRLWFGSKDCEVKIIGKTLDLKELGKDDAFEDTSSYDEWVSFGEPIPEGTRNNHAYHYAYKFGIEGIPKDRIIQLLVENWKKLGYAVPEAEIKYAVESALKKVGEVKSRQAHRPLTQFGNTERFIDDHHDIVRYVPEWEKWIVWNGKYWEPDVAQRVRKLGFDTIRNIYKEAADITDSDFRAKVAAHGIRSETLRMIIDMVRNAEPQLVARPDQLDSNPNKLNVYNGTLNLTTKQLEPHVKEDMITRIIPYEYNLEHDCERWEEWIRWACGGDDEIVEYIRLAAGRSLFGGNPEKEAFFAYGKPNTGKTTLTRVLEKAAGPYSQRFNIELLLSQKLSRNANDATPELAKLHGARLAVGSEVPAGRHLNESAFKDFTGKDTLTARYLHREPFDFVPQFTPWLYGNDRPLVRPEDEATFLRLRMLPFKVQVDPKELNPNLLEDVFEPEMPGILRWLFEGAVKARHDMRDKLKVPQASLDELREYRRDVDHVQQFVEAGALTPEAGARTKTSEIYAVFCGYEKVEHNMRYPSVNAISFGRQLVKLLSCTTVRSNGTNSVENWKLDTTVTMSWYADGNSF